jgi:pimeloyl-ACP methyl ester carboxylesterase
MEFCLKSIKPHFLFVHGAWHGGWVWKDVELVLRNQGYNVSCPTQTGLGERRHLLSKTITLDTFIEDIINHILIENLSNVILVGHSFAGSVITGVADKLKDRISRLIYFDAVILLNGQSAFDIAPGDIVKERLKLAQLSKDGLSVPPPKPEAFGVFDHRKAHMLEKRLTPHPISTFQSKLNIKNEVGNGLPLSYIFCTKPIYQSLESSRKIVRQNKWPIFELEGSHDAMYTHPKETLNLLMKIIN